MGNNLIADTSVLIDLQRGVKKTVSSFQVLQDKIAISRITACEFIFGSRDKNEKEVNKEFIENLIVIEISEQISNYSYQLIDKYGLGTNLGVADSLIASTCVVKNIPLWTLNKRHFKKIKELSFYEN